MPPNVELKFVMILKMVWIVPLVLKLPVLVKKIKNLVLPPVN